MLMMAEEIVALLSILFVIGMILAAAFWPFEDNNKEEREIIHERIIVMRHYPEGRVRRYAEFFDEEDDY